jgi:hypothetical protein
MKITTSVPLIYAEQPGLKHHELTEELIGIFYPQKSAVIGGKEVTRSQT